MVSIFVGSGAGFARGSGTTLGGSGVLGSAVQGRNGEMVSVNAATGNLLITQQDEFLVGRGPDSVVSRTYNSLAQASDDNGDQWRFGSQRQLQNWRGTANTAGATVERVGEDGSVVTYTYDVGLGYYRTTDGAGAHDKIVNVGHWIWTDGDTQTQEGYDIGGTLLGITDTDGNSVSFTYHAHTYGWRLSRATTANGEYQDYVWSGENLSQIVTGYTDLATGTAKTLTRTRYAYDGQNRLTQVTVDLTPADGSVADGKTYVTTYTYDGSSKRVASITQTDGSSLAITYDAVGRVATLTQAVAVGDLRVTSFGYGPDFTDIAGPDGQTTRLEYTGGNLASSSVPDWIAGGLNWEAAGAVGGEAAIKLTSTPGATWSAISAGLQAQAGDVFKFTASLQAVSGSSTTQTLGLYGDNSYWGADSSSSARIISGPGQLVRTGGGNWRVVGLSTTEATRIEIMRTYSQAENMGAYLYVDEPNGFGDGQQLVVAGTTLTKGGGDTPASRQLSRIIAPPASAGAPRQVMEFFYSANGDLIETRTGTLSQNLLDLDGWAGERRGPNLLDLSGWPANPDNLPGGNATLAGWANPGWTINEARWAKTIGPNGSPVAVIQTGQTDGLEGGGGNYSHGFAIDKNKAYEFTTYFQVTELDKHRVYFGLDGNNAVVNAADGTPNGNPYFAYPQPATGSNYKAGRWYRIVGYVLPAGSGNLQSAADLGGIFDVETGERVDNAFNYRWADTQPSGPQGGVRFFNYYNESISGHYTNYYRPEVHEINLSGDAASVADWYNWHAEETRWASTIGPDGKQAFVIEAGQTNATPSGGGNHSSYVDIDRSKAYEFTYYFQFTDTGKHSIYFGVHGPQAVEQLQDGVENSNPYFFAIGPDQQPANFAEGKWYKVVGYILPSGATAIPAGQMGGVYDAVTGAKVLDLANNFRWSSAGSDARIGVRFFNFYYENNLQYSTYFGKPEIREAGYRTATPGGYVGYAASTVTDRTFFEYDTNGNLVETRDNEGNVVTRTYGSKNELLTETRTHSDASGAAVSHTTRYVYDSENHLRYEISAEGRVAQYSYHATGELYTITEYPEHGYPLGSAPPSEAAMDAWHAAIADRQSLKHSYMVYDARGNMTQKVSYGYMTSGGAGSTSEGYTHSFWTYDQNGRVLSRQTAPQNSETFVYDGLGRLTASTDMAGGTTTIVFNDTALTTTVTTASGATTISSYNKAGDLVGEIQSGNYDLNRSASHLYDKNGRLRRTIDATGVRTYHLYDKMGRTVADINSYGDLIEYRYDPAGRIAATIRYGNVLTAGQLAMLDDPNSTAEMSDIRPAAAAEYDIWSWSIYDDAGRLIQSVAGDGSTSAFSYDTSDRLVKTTRYYNKLSAGQLAAFKVAAPVAPVLPAVDARDTVSRSFYNRDGLLVGSLDGEGYLSEIVYDDAGQKVEEIAYATRGDAAYLASGTFDQLRATVSPGSIANRRSHYVHDGQGFLRFAVDNAGYVTEYVYESDVEWGAIGPVRSTVRHAVAIATSDFTYDNVKALVGANAGHASNRASWSVYNPAGRLSYTIDPDGAVTGFTYDVSGNVIKTVAFATRRPTDSVPHFSTMDSWYWANHGDPANRITRNWYTAAGDLRFSVDGEGYARRFDYDAEGRLTREVTWADKVVATDATTIEQIDSIVYTSTNWTDVQYTYDLAGRQNSVYDGEGNRTVYLWYGNGERCRVIHAYGTPDQSDTVFGFDGAGRIVSEYSAYGEPEQAVTFYSYDGLGNRTSITDPRGKVTYYTYDERGLVLTKTDAAGGVTFYEYNAFGEVMKTTDPRGNATYSYYDGLGRVTSTRDAEDYVTETSYTRFGEIASVTRRYNKTASAAGTATLPAVTAHAQDATTSFEYDKRGLVTKTTDAEGFFETCVYDAFGNRERVIGKSAGTTAIAGGTTYYAYDRRGLLAAETLPAPSADKDGNVLAYYTTNNFSYDARGNRIQMVEAAGLPEARTTTYVYDKADRLTETRMDVIRVVPATGQNIVETRIDRLTYDARGNVTSRTDPAGARTVYYYDDLGRVVATIDAVGTYSANIYDANGNITSTTVYGTAVAIPVDGGSEEEKPAPPGGEARTTSFTYDDLNRLLTSSVAGVASYAFNGSTWVKSTDPITTTYEYDANGNAVKTIDASGGVVWNYYDKLGRKEQQLDPGGYLTSWSYDGEGNVLSERRYATRFTGSPTTSNSPGVGTNGADRVTQYSYDRNGNRLIEQRRDVLIHNGAGGTSNVHATVYFQYNGLGQVVRKIEATGEDIQYQYDSAGRIGREIRSAFQDHQGNTVNPTIDYFYNGLGDLTRTVAAGAGDAAARITRYQYGTGGVLEWVQDSSGQTVYHYQDVAGRNPGTLINHQRSDGTVVASREYSLQDAVGRVTETASYYYDYTPGAGWDWGVPHRNVYNAYGEIVSTTVNGATTSENRYDGGGRLIATTAGDGVWKHFGYDAGGNRTIAITSAGASLGGLSFDQALTLVGQEDVNATYTQYDARGQAVSVTEEQRRLSAGNVQTLTSMRSYNAFGDVISETNAAGATTSYSYNNIGRMIRSEGPSVEITLENGTKQWVKPAQDFYYDASGRLVATRDANGSYAAGGASGNGTSKDANSGNLTRLTLLAGTGYGGSEALVTAETHADGGVKQTRYDVHGDARTLIDEVGRTTTQVFDGMGRVTQASHAGGLIDSYAYDGLGQRIKHWNNFLGAGEVETTDYDTQGRVIKTRAFGGDVTTTSYAWDATIAASGMGVTTGGWTQVTTMANGRSATEKSDLFGRVTWKSDLGGHVTSYGYDLAGRQILSAMGGLTASFTYFNTGQQATNNGPAGTATYAYDAAGNRVAESLVNGVAIKSASATYDAMGRLKTWTEAGTAKSPAASTTHDYDANGNIRRAQASFAYLDGGGTPYGYTAGSDSWYRYDSMNRLVTDKGQLSGTAGAAGTIIVRGYNNKNATSSGRDIVYDVAGQRVGVLTSLYEPGQWEFYHDPHTLPSPDDPGEYTYVPGVFRELRENYTYDGAGRLTEVRNAAGAMIQESYTPEGGGDGTPSAPVPGAPATGGYLRGSFAYDLMGRLTLQQDYGSAGGGPGMFQGAVYSRALTYNAKGQVTSDDVSTAKGRYGTLGWDIFRSVTTYDYGWGANYALGSVVSQSATNSKFASGGSWSSQPGTTTTTAYAWYDGAVQDLVTHDYDTGSGSNPLYTTDLLLNGFGQMTGAIVADGVAKSVGYTLDETGQIIRRDETRTSAPSEAAPHEVYYRFGGRQMGMTGNNGTADLGYVQSTETRSAGRPEPTTTTAGLFRDGTKTSPGSYADFATSYDPYNSDYQGSAGGLYRVAQGDTLQSIAAAIWGDANLWYKLAEANGIGANGALIEGQVLNLPTGVMRSGHSASTNRPYDPTDALGDLSPTTPKPPKKPKCGMLGMVLVAAIAIGLSAWLGPQMIGAVQGVIGGAAAGTAAATTASVASGVIGGAAAGAVSSAVSQAFGVVTGIQDKFSWKGVGLAAIAGGIGGGIAGLGSAANAAASNGLALNGFGKFAQSLGGNGVGMAIGRGVFVNAATQGIGLATGLQSKFDFAGVAAAAAVSGIAQLASNSLPNAARYNDNGTLKTAASTGNVIASSAAGAIAGAATRSALTGESFGDNLMRALPDVIANSLILAGGAVLAQRGGNDGGGGSAAARAVSNIEGASQLEGDYPWWLPPIDVIAQKTVTGALSLVGGLINALGGPNPFGAFNMITSLDRIAMNFTNPVPLYNPGMMPGQRLQYEFAKGLWDGAKALGGSLGTMARQSLDLSPVGLVNAGLEAGGWNLGPAAPNVRNVFDRGISAAKLGADVGVRPGVYVGRAMAAAAEAWDRGTATLSAAGAGDTDAIRSLARLSGRATFELGTAAVGGWGVNASAKASRVVVAAESGNVASNAALHVNHINLLRTTEAANPLVDSLRATGGLPANYATKADAALAGWQPGKALENFLPGGQIGGDVFRNSTNLVPGAAGRIWYEADVGLVGTMSRANQPGTRLLYSNEGHMYVTFDHYATAHPIGRYK